MGISKKTVRESPSQINAIDTEGTTIGEHNVAEPDLDSGPSSQVPREDQAGLSALYKHRSSQLFSHRKRYPLTVIV